MTVNNSFSKISTGISERIPQQLRDDHPNFTKVMELYFQYLEQTQSGIEGKVIERAKNLKKYRDIDTALSGTEDRFYNQFMALIPQESQVDKALLLKNVRAFYRARGTEKSLKFLLRLLSSGTKDAEIYYPKLDILRTSSSTWYIQKTLKLLSMAYDNTPITENTIVQFGFFNGTQIRGNTSGATAIVDSADHFYENGYLVDELTLSSITGTFAGGETIFTTFVDDDGVTHTLTGVVNPGQVTSIQVINPGLKYTVGSIVPIEAAPNSNGSGASAIISSVSQGSILNVTIQNGGVGYRASDPILFSGGGMGSGAVASVITINDNQFYHSNTYNIDSSIIQLEANTQIGNAVYSNLNSANANVAIGNAISTFVYAIAGPVTAIQLTSGGSNYDSIPTASISGNTRVRSIGILAKMNVQSRGTGYNVGETIVFTNVIGGHGVGAKANITNTFANGAINTVNWMTVTGFPPGGIGYENAKLPSLSFVTNTGTGAIVTVEATLASGEALSANVSAVGEILSISLISGGLGYNVAPTVNLTGLGDGTAKANANIVFGLFSYPGRFLNDDGFLSAYNFLEDADYYQNYSYVIRMDESLDKYKIPMKKLIHPAGMIFFGEFLLDVPELNTTININTSSYTTCSNYSPNSIYFDGSTYFVTSNNPTVNVHFNAMEKTPAGSSANITHRLIYAANTIAANGRSKVRLTVQAPATALNIAELYIGYSNSIAPNIYDFESTPSRVNLGGSTLITIPAASNVITDWVFFPVNKNKPLMIAVYTDSSFGTRSGGNTSLSVTNYWKAGGNIANLVTTGGGYAVTNTGEELYIKQIEVDTAFTDNTITLSAWIKPNSLPTFGNSMYILSGNDAVAGITAPNTYLAIVNGATSNSSTGCYLEFNLANGNVSIATINSNPFSIPIVDKEWQHVMISLDARDSSKAGFYINNVNALHTYSNTGVPFFMEDFPLYFGSTNPKSNDWIASFNTKPTSVSAIVGGGITLRNFCASGNVKYSGSKIRLTLQGDGITYTNVAEMWIGYSDGVSANFTSPPIQVTFNGGSNSSNIPVNGNVVSDNVTFPLKANTFFMFSAYVITDSSGRFEFGQSNGSKYGWVSANYSANSNVSFAANGSNRFHTIWKIETFIGANGSFVNYNGHVADFIMANTWVDLSDLNNRKNLEANLMPVNPLTNFLANNQFGTVIDFRKPVATANVNNNFVWPQFNIGAGAVTTSGANDLPTFI